MAATNSERLAAAFGKLRAVQRNNGYLDTRMQEFMLSADDGALYAVNVYQLAHEWGVNRRDLLSWFVYATHAGLFDLSWAVRCPHCQRVSTDLGDLNGVSHVQFCPTCTVNYDVGFDDQVEVTFSVTPAIRAVDPAQLPPEHFHFAEHVHGLDVALLPEFVALFKDQTLSTRESLAVRTLTILFTDIVGSTQLYSRLGDAHAYNLVRDHFEVLFAAIAANEGQIVKTIGDAVMAAFVRPDCALRAALVAQQDIAAFNGSRPVETDHIFIKIGIHSGPAIMVTLNEQIDYFGTMINQSARIQSQSKSEEIVLSEAIYTDPDVQHLLQQEGAVSVTTDTVKLRGLDDAQTLYRVMRQS